MSATVISHAYVGLTSTCCSSPPGARIVVIPVTAAKSAAAIEVRIIIIFSFLFYFSFILLPCFICIIKKITYNRAFLCF